MNDLTKLRSCAKVIFGVIVFFCFIYSLNLIGKVFCIPRGDGIIGGISLNVFAGIVPQCGSVDSISDAFVLLIFLACFNAVGFFVASLLRSTWVEETPFSAKNIRRLKLLALALLLFEPVCKLAAWCQRGITGHMFLYNTENIWFFFYPMAIIIYILALVFQYGVVLQTQADVTL